MHVAYRQLIGPVYLPSFLMSVSQEALMVLLPLYVLEAGFGSAVAAFVIGLRGVAVLFSNIPAGQLVSQFGERPVLMLGLGTACLAYGLLAATDALAPLCIAALLFGFSFAAWMLGRQSYIAAVCAPEHTGRAIAVMAGIQRGGAFAGPLLGGLLAASAGYATAFGLSALLTVVAGLIVYSSARQLPAVESGVVKRESFVQVLRAHRRVFATAGFAAMVLQLMRAARQLLIPLFGQSAGLDVGTIGAIYAVSAAIDMCLFYPVGLLVDRRGRRWSAIPAMVLFSIGLALLPFADGPGALTAVALLLGFANGCGTGIVMIMGADLARRAADRGRFLSVWRVIGDTGTSAAPLATGAVIAAGGLAAASFGVAALGACGAAVMIFLVAETKLGNQA